MKHALVVGGTGMLKDVCLWLTEQNYNVSVIGRNQERFEQVENECLSPSQLHFLQLDYRNPDVMAEKIKEAINKFGPIDLIVSWIHSTAPNALDVIKNTVFAYSQEIDIYQVISSNVRKISLEVHRESPARYRNHFVQLGFVLEAQRSRWLTHTEISEGVIQGIQAKQPYHLVGVLEPWELRP
jgi:NAD(P)-dependent dehydrogenase (short-subunit alcohol dehydrogenase family)